MNCNSTALHYISVSWYQKAVKLAILADYFIASASRFQTTHSFLKIVVRKSFQL